MAQITHKLEILVNAADPVPEINNVILAFLQLHPGRETEILTELQTEILAAIGHYSGHIEAETVIGGTIIGSKIATGTEVSK